jgi:hypothetical protein
MIDDRIACDFGNTEAAFAARRTHQRNKDQASVMHPFDTENIARATNNTAFPSGIFKALYGHNSSLLNYGIILFFPNSLFKSRHDPARCVPAINWPLLEREGSIKIRDARWELALGMGINEFSDRLVACFAAGYLCGYLDEFYIPESPTFNRRHNKHETLLCGYDSSLNSVGLAMYDSRGNFRIIQTPLLNVLLALTSKEGWPPEYTYDARDRAMGFCDEMRKPFYLITPAEAECHSINASLVYAQFEDALNSRSTYSAYIGDPLTNWTENEGVYGLAYYDSCADFVALCLDSARPIDLRATRLIVEHKAMMLERLTQLESQGYIFGDGVRTAYRNMLSMAKGIHLNCIASVVRGVQKGGGQIVKDLRALPDIERGALQLITTALREN